MISHEYGAHSALFGMIMNAVEKHDATDDGHHIDKNIKKVLDNFY